MAVQTIETISPKALFQRIQEGESVEIIDVRTPAEFRSWHANPSRLVPLDALDCDKIMAGRNGNAGAPLYVMCKSGMRSSQACKKFVEANHDCVVLIEGGLEAWEREGLPVERTGREMISVDRQVRVAVGLMIIAAGLSGIFVAPWAAWLPVLFGVGLLQSGITDTCPLAMLIARMPWNR